MKRFLVPAFFVIHADNEQGAETIAGNALQHANYNLRQCHKDNCLFLDEELPNREVQIHPDETELPHTYKEYSDEQQRRDEKHGLYPEHEDVAN